MKAMKKRMTLAIFEEQARMKMTNLLITAVVIATYFASSSPMVQAATQGSKSKSLE